MTGVGGFVEDLSDPAEASPPAAPSTARPWEPSYLVCAACGFRQPGRHECSHRGTDSSRYGSPVENAFEFNKGLHDPATQRAVVVGVKIAGLVSG